MKEVKIGNQTWMAENLNINDGGEGIFVNPKNGETYYTWEAAMRVAKSIEGWHLPSNDEWETLFNAVGGTSTAGTKLKSTSGWEDGVNSTDSYGFSALAAGYYNGFLCRFVSEGKNTYFWSSTESDSDYVYVLYLLCSYEDANMSRGSDKWDYGFSVRLIKD